MKKVRQFLAMLGVILLVGLYLTTLILAILDNSYTQKFFLVSIYATVIIPTLIWAYGLIYRLVKKGKTDQDR